MKQIFVVLKEQFDSVQDASGKYVQVPRPVLSGYASEYNQSSDRLNKKNKALLHMAGYYTSQNDVLIRKEYDYTARVWNEIPVPGNLLPRIYDNIPTSGFKISDFTSRYSTANKYWLIQDPRGFTLEISTQNMLDIILNCTIENGKIVESCVWDFGKQGIGKSKLVKA